MDCGTGNTVRCRGLRLCEDWGSSGGEGAQLKPLEESRQIERARWAMGRASLSSDMKGEETEIGHLTWGPAGEFDKWGMAQGSYKDSCKC